MHLIYILASFILRVLADPLHWQTILIRYNFPNVAAGRISRSFALILKFAAQVAGANLPQTPGDPTHTWYGRDLHALTVVACRTVSEPERCLERITKWLNVIVNVCARLLF